MGADNGVGCGIVAVGGGMLRAGIGAEGLQMRRCSSLRRGCDISMSVRANKLQETTHSMTPMDVDGCDCELDWVAPFKEE